MDELIPYQSRLVGHEQLQTVDGRDLYSFLEIRKEYTNWIKTQIKRANLVENIDFIIYAHKGVNSHAGRPSHEYYFTFEACKLIGMMANSQKGHEIRKYFLECEARLEETSHTGRDPLFERYPELKAIALAREEARLARDEAAAANANALLAMRGQSWVTIRQYVTMYHLERQMPKALQQAYGRWLTGLCLERRCPVYELRSEAYDVEHTYWIVIIDETLTGWLTRRHGQGNLGLA